MAPVKRGEVLTAWRIARAEFAENALSGVGGLHADGRWHFMERPVVYLASAWSLAALEVIVHMGRHDSALPFVYLGVTIPPTVTALRLKTDALPQYWMSQPPRPETQALGAQWLLSKESLLLQTPSALSPVEYNWILNPLHPEANLLTASEPVEFRFDQRLWKSNP